MSTNYHLEELFSHAYILGGSPCSGKSTIAELLAAEYNLHYYKADDHDPEHMQQSTPEQHPVMYRYAKMSWDEIWLQNPEKLCADELTFYEERFPFILNDLTELDAKAPALLEGAAFLPEQVHRFPIARESVVFMVPTLKFQCHYYRQRPWIQSILNQCRDPNQAFENWMKRDHLFGLEIMHRAEKYGFHVILVDGSVDITTRSEIIKKRYRLK